MAHEAVVILPTESQPFNTERATRQSVKLFYDFLAEKDIPEPEDASSLREVLKTFYVQAKKTNGSLYSKNSLQCLRYGLCRHFKLIFGVDIINDLYFKEANKYYQSVCIFLKNQGLDRTDHRPPILENDIRKLYQSSVFSLEYPRTLQNKVFFEIVLFFCRRRKQNPRDLRSSDFEFRVDKNGRRYVCRSGQEVPEDCEETEEESELNIMYERGGPLCPVNSLEQYMKHLCPDNPILFQRPKKDHFASSDIWYDNMAYGERALAEKMKKIASEAKLSQQFVTHSARITSISRWSKCLFGSSCSWVASKAIDCACTSCKCVDESAGVESPVKKLKVSETVSKFDDGETRQRESQGIENSQQTLEPVKGNEDKTAEWLEYKCKSGQVLLVKIAEKPSQKTFCSIGTQTEESSCTNGCTSKFVSQENLPTPITPSTTHKMTYMLYTTKRKANEDVQDNQDIITFDDNTAYDSDSDWETISESGSRGNQSYASDLSAVLKVLDESDYNPENMSSTASAASSEQGKYKRKTGNHISDNGSSAPACRGGGRHTEKHCKEEVQEECLGSSKNDYPQDTVCISRDRHAECGGCQDHSNISSCKRKNVEHGHKKSVSNNGLQSRSTKTDEFTHQRESSKELHCCGNNDIHCESLSMSTDARNDDHKDEESETYKGQDCHVENNVRQNSAAICYVRTESMGYIHDDYESTNVEHKNFKSDNTKAIQYCSKNNGLRESICNCQNNGHLYLDEKWQAYCTSETKDYEDGMTYQSSICKQRNKEGKEDRQRLEQGTDELTHDTLVHKKEESQGYILYQNSELNIKEEKHVKHTSKVYCNCLPKINIGKNKSPVNENEDNKRSQLVMKARQIEPKRKATFSLVNKCTCESPSNKKRKLESRSTKRYVKNDMSKTCSIECLEKRKDLENPLVVNHSCMTHLPKGENRASHSEIVHLSLPKSQCSLHSTSDLEYHCEGQRIIHHPIKIGESNLEEETTRSYKKKNGDCNADQEMFSRSSTPNMEFWSKCCCTMQKT